MLSVMLGGVRETVHVVYTSGREKVQLTNCIAIQLVAIYELIFICVLSSVNLAIGRISDDVIAACSWRCATGTQEANEK